MNIFKIFDTIEEIVFSSQRMPWPFGQWSVINRQNFLRMLDKMRHSVPEEMKHAREVTREVDRLLAEAHDRSEAIVAEARTLGASRLEEARNEREQLINVTEVVKTARVKAAELEEAARTQARDMEKAARVRCQEMREQAEEEARRVVAEARAEARRCEKELDAWVVRRLIEVERDLERALNLMRTHRHQVEQNPPLPKDDLATVEMPAVTIPPPPTGPSAPSSPSASTPEPRGSHAPRGTAPGAPRGG